MASYNLGLQGLPSEVLQQIASYLNAYRPSLYAFSLTSKTCHNVSLPLILSKVYLKITTRQVLERDVSAVAKTLTNSKCTRYIRCLSIKEFLRLSDKPRVEGYKSSTPDRCSRWTESTWAHKYSGDEILDQYAPYIIYDEPVIARNSEEDMAWAPVVELIKTLPCLYNLVYDCWNQFPPCLLNAIDNRHRQIKLYHLTFRFRTLLWGNPNPYEMALATSPCLYCIKVACGQRDSDGDDDFNQEATMELAAGLAPNLKKVTVVNLRPEYSWKYDHRPRGPWLGLPGFVRGKSIGSLTSLSLVGLVDLNSRNIIQTWAQHTDFNSLRHLNIGGGHGNQNIGMNEELMEWIARNCSFPQLKILRIHLQRQRIGTGLSTPNFVKNAILLFETFEPLDELSIFGSFEPRILDAILSRHGETLKKLMIHPSELGSGPDDWRGRRTIPMTFAKEHIQQIQTHCPALQELAVSVKRTKSDALEAETYKVFGDMERLQFLFLILDCSDWQVTQDPCYEPLYFGEDCETYQSLDFLKKGHIRDAFMNCAVDETLARAIWETICQRKRGQQMQSLKLWTAGAGEWGASRTTGEIPGVFTNLSRSWLIERVPRDDQNIINIRELSRRDREASDQILTDYYKRRADYLQEKGIKMELADVAVDSSQALKIFRRIWPRKKGSKDWREDWSSLPLPV